MSNLWIKQFVTLGSGAILSVLVINLSISNRTFRLKLFEHSKVNYFFVYDDWWTKIGWIFQKSPQNEIYILGSSRSIYGISPRLMSSGAVNLGLYASSFRETLDTYKLLLNSQTNGRSVFIVELNPISLADFHIQMIFETQRDWLMDLFLSGHRWLFMLADVFPLLKYRTALSSVAMASIDPSIEIDADVQALRKSEFGQIESSHYLGYVDLEVPEPVRKPQFASCSEMAAMSLSDGRWEAGKNLLDQFIETSREHKNVNSVYFFVPPAHPDFKSLPYEKIETELKDIFRQSNVRLLAFSDFNSADFFDCVHLNRSGSTKLTNRINGVIFEQK